MKSASSMLEILTDHTYEGELVGLDVSSGRIALARALGQWGDVVAARE